MQSLIALLQTNARISLEDLGKALNLPTEEVAALIDQLEREGAIIGYQTIFDVDKVDMGSHVEAVIEVRITPEREGGFDRLAARIARFDEVRSCYLMSGGYDLLIIVQGETLQAVARFVAERLSTIKGIIGTATHFRLKTYKENGLMHHREAAPDRLPVTP